MSDFTFDYDELSKLLLDACRQAFTEMQTKHSDETFYAFVLGTSAEQNAIYLAANTEELLDRHAKEYFERWGLKEGITLEQVKTRERYSRHLILYSSSAETVHTQNLIKEIDEQLVEGFGKLWQIRMEESPSDILDNKTANFHEKQLDEMCLNVLQQLDKEGVFGVKEKRLDVVVSYRVGFVTDPRDRLFHADILNPPPVGERIKREVDAAMKVWEIIKTNRDNARNQNDKNPE